MLRPSACELNKILEEKSVNPWGEQCEKPRAEQATIKRDVIKKRSSGTHWLLELLNSGESIFESGSRVDQMFRAESRKQNVDPLLSA